MRLTFEALDSIIDNNKNIDMNRIYILDFQWEDGEYGMPLSRRPNFFAAEMFLFVVEVILSRQFILKM